MMPRIIAQSAPPGRKIALKGGERSPWLMIDLGKRLAAKAEARWEQHELGSVLQR
jgi:hypothetical protein